MGPGGLDLNSLGNVMTIDLLPPLPRLCRVPSGDVGESLCWIVDDIYFDPNLASVGVARRILYSCARRGIRTILSGNFSEAADSAWSAVPLFFSTALLALAAAFFATLIGGVDAWSSFMFRQPRGAFLCCCQGY